MQAINDAFEGADAFRKLMQRIEDDNTERAARHSIDDGSVQAIPPGDNWRRPGENRAAHRARLKAERRSAKRAPA